MRRMTRHTLWIPVLLAPLLAAPASAGEPEVNDGLDVYFRDVDLGALSEQALPKYIDAEPGESKLLERSFEGAPPQISHTVEDMLPILADENECLECHHPDNAVEEGDLPFPKSHLERPVMARGGEGDAMVWVVKGYEEAKDLVGSRYSCTMCHAPQATNVRTPRNLFEGLRPEGD